MANFLYIARQMNGQTAQGALIAMSEKEALATLVGRGLFPLQVTPETAKRAASQRVSARILTSVYRQLADLLRAGVPLTRGLEILAQQAKHPGLNDVMPRILRAVRDGSPLASAMAEHPAIFHDLVVNMVRAGEEGGFLEDALQRVAILVERQDELHSRLMGALAYPLFLVGTGLVVVLGMLIFFVPNFVPIFDRLAKEGQLPWLTRLLMAMSDMLRGQSWGLAIALIAVLGLVAFGLRQSFVSEWLQRKRLSIVAIGPILRDLAVARFCRVLGTLLSNGVPMLKSIKISRAATGDKEIEAAIASAARQVTAGHSLAKPLADCRHFTAEVLEMIAVGEQSNRLEHVLVDVADTLDRRSQRQIDLLVKFIEPALLLVIALLVLLLVVGLLLPAFDSAGTIS